MPEDHTDRLQQLFETMATGVVFQARSGAIIAANPAAGRILGRSIDDLMGRTSHDETWQAIRRDGSVLPGDQHPAMVALRTGEPVRDADSEPDRGATFKILLPATDREAPERPEPARSRWRGTGTILLVDDEETVRVTGARMLEAMGFDVLLASDGREGLSVFRDRAEEIVLVLLDMTMPQMGGTEVYREMRRVQPDVPVILITGYNEQEATSRFAGKGRLRAEALRARDRAAGGPRGAGAPPKSRKEVRCEGLADRWGGRA